MSLTASKMNLINELFVRTADENYVTARWCATNRFNTDFLWLAVHALEKYCKAVLLANGRSARRPDQGGKSYSHDVVRLYEAVKAIGAPLLPDLLVKPTDLQIPHWTDRTPEHLMEHLLRNGNADNRYLIHGYTTRSQDLHMLDAIVFAIRRLVCPLDDRMFPSSDPQAPKVTFREVLSRNGAYFPSMFMPLDDLITAKTDTPARSAALNLNMAFAPQDYPHEPMRTSSSARNPVIVRRILAPSKATTRIMPRKASRSRAGFSRMSRCRRGARPTRR